ncbi:MAG TPA: hypothetical protein DC047_18380 [Blastocatellia bacterium]|nr:hypothetical protein [Blastocatellia bacterium]
MLSLTLKLRDSLRKRRLILTLFLVVLTLLLGSLLTFPGEPGHAQNRPTAVEVGSSSRPQRDKLLTVLSAGNQIKERLVQRLPDTLERVTRTSVLMSSPQGPQAAQAPDKTTDNLELARLIEEDRAEHSSSAAKSMEASALAARRRARAARVKELYSQNKLNTGNDYSRAAMMLLRGDGSEDYKLGERLRTVATSKQGTLQPLQTGPEQNCNFGIPVCQNTYVQSQSYTGIGSLQESNGSCLSGGETNSVWYIFTIQSSGTLTFTLNTSFDYDFALYNITNNGCAGVLASTPVRCNYSGTAGSTGLILPAQAELPALSQGAAGTPTMAGITAVAGSTYALLVDNYTSNQNGYTLTFSGTAVIADATPPTIVSANMDTASCLVEITLSEPVRCSTIAANGSDFVLSAPGSGATVTGASGINCGAFTNKIRLTYTLGEAPACGLWRVTTQAGSDGNTLIDNCNNPLAAGGTTTFSSPHPAVAQIAMPTEFCEGATVIADGSASSGAVTNFWSVQESDANWNPIGPEYSGWFPGPPGTFDVSHWAAQSGLTLKCGKYYRVKVAVQNCCTRWSEAVQLIHIRCPLADAGPDRTVCCCGPLKMQIGSAPVAGVTYSWSPAIGLDDPTLANPTIDFSVFNGTSVAFPSVYEVTATDAFGCTSKDSVFIKTVCSCRPPAKVTATRQGLCSRTYTLTADCACGDTTATYLWSAGGQTTQSISVEGGTGPYTVTCRNECGATISQPIIAPPATVLEGGFPGISCPNVFTPNGDNVNDFWVVQDPGLALGASPAYNATDYEFEVFDRWGSRVVYLSGSTTSGFANGSIPHWDGTANQSAIYSWWQHLWGKEDTFAGANLSDGTYFYFFRMKNCTNGWTDICYGHVAIFR